MWEALAGAASVLIAAFGYWLKKTADTSGAKHQQLRDQLEATKIALASSRRKIRLFRTLYRQTLKELKSARTKNLDNMSVDDAAELLRQPEAPGGDTPAD